MVVSPGESCSYDLFLGRNMPSIGGFGSRSSFTISDAKILTKPAHGRAGLSGRSSVAYNASSTYRGSDTFRVQFTTEQAGPAQVDFVVQVR